MWEINRVRSLIIRLQVLVGARVVPCKSSMLTNKSAYYPPMRKPCKLKVLKRYIFSSATGMQYAGSGLKLPCNRTFKRKNGRVNALIYTVQSQRIDSASNRLLDFTQSITTTKGTKTLATTSAQVNYALDALGNMATDGLRDFS